MTTRLWFNLITLLAFLALLVGAVEKDPTRYDGCNIQDGELITVCRDTNH